MIMKSFIIIFSDPMRVCMCKKNKMQLDAFTQLNFLGALMQFDA